MKLRSLILAGVTGLGLWQWSRQMERANKVSLKNKVVIITGASSGIGRASARIFSAQGAHTVLVARRANVLAEVQSELQADFDTRIITVAGDVTNADDIQTVVDATLEAFGRIDVLVNNAGLLNVDYLENVDFDEWQQLIDVNLSGLIRMTQAVLPTMKAQHSGHIVNVGSVVSFMTPPGNAVYTATKSGLQGFSDALRIEVQNNNISVSLVMPGYTDTPMVKHSVDTVRNDPQMSNLLTVETSDYVASHIVASVRYNKRDVVLGGSNSQVMRLMHQFMPKVVDNLYAQMIDTDDLIQKQNGHSQLS